MVSEIRRLLSTGEFTNRWVILLSVTTPKSTFTVHTFFEPRQGDFKVSACSIRRSRGDFSDRMSTALALAMLNRTSMLAKPDPAPRLNFEVNRLSAFIAWFISLYSRF